VASDQGDPLAEADFHMAYGLYDQAADLVRIAISASTRRDLRPAGAFFVWGNKDHFCNRARLSANRDQAVAGEWEKSSSRAGDCAGRSAVSVPADCGVGSAVI
jgi:pilus assembly protein FimV